MAQQLLSGYFSFMSLWRADIFAQAAGLFSSLLITVNFSLIDFGWLFYLDPFFVA